MKSVFIVFIYFFVSIQFANANHSNIMLCNSNGTTCSPHATVQSAYDAAVNGDIIYLPPGVFILPNILKEISIIGAGANPDSSIAVGGITSVSNSFRLGASNISLEGIYFMQEVNFGHNPVYDLNNLEIKFCRFTNLAPSGDWLYNGRMNNSKVYACYFEGYLSCGLNPNGVWGGYGSTEVQGIQGANNIISNCVMAHLQRFESSVVRNCIFNFANWNGGLDVLYNSTIEDCIFNTPNTWIGTWGNSNLIRNCYYRNVNLAPNDILQNSVQYDPNNSLYPFDISLAGANIPFPVKNTANIAVGHPAKTAGVYGGEVGINGGFLSWNQHGCVPSNPHFYFRDIANQVNNSNNLPVNLKIRTGN